MGVHLAARRNLLRRFGRPLTLRRGLVAAECVGYLTRYSPDEIAGTALRQGDAKVQLFAADLAAAGFPVPPRNPDELRTANNSWTVLFANPVFEAAELIGWTLAVRGG